MVSESHPGGNAGNDEKLGSATVMVSAMRPSPSETSAMGVVGRKEISAPPTGNSSLLGRRVGRVARLVVDVDERRGRPSGSPIFRAASWSCSESWVTELMASMRVSAARERSSEQPLVGQVRAGEVEVEGEAGSEVAVVGVTKDPHTPGRGWMMMTSVALLGG